MRQKSETERGSKPIFTKWSSSRKQGDRARHAFSTRRRSRRVEYKEYNRYKYNKVENRFNTPIGGGGDQENVTFGEILWREIRILKHVTRKRFCFLIKTYLHMGWDHRDRN